MIFLAKGKTTFWVNIFQLGNRFIVSRCLLFCNSSATTPPPLHRHVTVDAAAGKNVTLCLLVGTERERENGEQMEGKKILSARLEQKRSDLVAAQWF